MAYLIAAISALVMFWSLVKLIRHKINETRAGMEIYEKLRNHETFGQLIRLVMLEPLLGMSKEAAHLDQTRNMMRSYWLTGLYALIFFIAMVVFIVSTGSTS